MTLSRRALLGRLGAVAVLPATLSACAEDGPFASDEEVARAIYRHDGPPSVTHFTMINNRSEEGAHAALMVNASQRVIFNPAGTFNHPQIPERNDVHFGITDRAVDFFIDYHARETFRVRTNEIPVSAASAERALALVQEAGPVGPARCNISIVAVLRELPEFQDMPSSWFPKKTMNYLESRPDSRTAVYRDDSPDNRDDIIIAPPIR